MRAIQVEQQLVSDGDWSVAGDMRVLESSVRVDESMGVWARQGERQPCRSPGW